MMTLLKTFVVCLLFSAISLAAPVKKCEDLASTAFGPEVTIESARLLAAAGDLPEHCLGSHVEGGKTLRGSVDAAENFVCGTGPK